MFWNLRKQKEFQGLGVYEVNKYSDPRTNFLKTCATTLTKSKTSVSERPSVYAKMKIKKQSFDRISEANGIEIAYPDEQRPVLCAPSMYNNMKRNPDVISGFQIAIGVLFGIGLGVFHTYILEHFAFDDMDHKAWLYPKIFLEIILLRIVAPIYHIYNKRELRQFIYDCIQNHIWRESGGLVNKHVSVFKLVDSIHLSEIPDSSFY